MSTQINKNHEVIITVQKFVRRINDHQDSSLEWSTVVKATSQIPITNIDIWEQRLRWEVSYIEKAKPASKWLWSSPSKRHVTWLDLINGNGFMRENALKSLSDGAPNSFFFALALRRLNDWVPQVREAAREYIPILINKTNPENVVDVLFAILPHWISWGRMEPIDRDVILRLIEAENISSTLTSRIQSSATGPLASILAQICRTPALDIDLNDIAKNAVQPAVRAKAYSFMLERKAVWSDGKKWEWTSLQWSKGRFVPRLNERPIDIKYSLLEILENAVDDRSPIVRRVAGDILIKNRHELGADSIRLASKLAKDSYPSVAECGNFILSQRGKFDT